MTAQRESAVRTGEINTTPYKIIRIVPHHAHKRKSRTHRIVVKSITFAAALMAVYGLMYMENRMISTSTKEKRKSSPSAASPRAIPPPSGSSSKKRRD